MYKDSVYTSQSSLCQITLCEETVEGRPENTFKSTLCGENAKCYVTVDGKYNYQ
jgi:hypothetical protein